MPRTSAEAQGRYEVREHPTLDGLVVIWWLPATGTPSPTNMTLGQDRLPLMAEALADYELRHAEPEVRRAAGLRVVREDGAV
jgi:hypothetical protein